MVKLYTHITQTETLIISTNAVFNVNFVCIKNKIFLAAVYYSSALFYLA